MHYTHFLTWIVNKHPLSITHSWLSCNVVSLKAATGTNAANVVLLAPIYGYQAITSSNASLHLIQVNIWSKQHQSVSSALKKCCFLVRGSHSNGWFVLLLSVRPLLSFLVSGTREMETPCTASTIQILTFFIFQNCSLANLYTVYHFSYLFTCIVTRYLLPWFSIHSTWKNSFSLQATTCKNSARTEGAEGVIVPEGIVKRKV